MFDINYTKNNNTDLFKSLEDNDVMKPQNYIPLYKNFFDLSSLFDNINEDIYCTTVHLNDTGQDLLAKKIYEILNKENIFNEYI